MNSFRSALKLFIVLIVLIGLGTFAVTNYAWVFSKRIKGEILGVERVTELTATLGSRVTDAQLHSYSILIRGEDGVLYTSSSEDSQWQVAKVGYCVDALLYRNPPWALDKANTFFNARIKELKDCPGKASAPPVPTESAAPPAAPAPPVTQ